MKDLLRLDINPLEILILLVGFISTWTILKKDSRWHTSWIMKHDKECDEQRKSTNKLFSEIQATNAHLVTLTEGHEKRLDRLERQEDKA